MPSVTPTPNQFIGSLIGQALGDALGFAVEGYPPESCLEYVEQLRADKLRARGRGEFPFGQYTDDTQLARELLHSLALTEGFKPEDYAQKIAFLFSSGRVVGRGKATEEAARRLFNGIPWDKAGTPAPAAGNGSAMRAGPVGLMYYDRPKELKRVADNQGRMTHQDPRCRAGAIAIAAAVAQALEPEKPEPRAFCKAIVARIQDVDRSVAHSISRLPQWLKLPPEQACEPIRQEGLDPEYQHFWQGISPFVTGSVLWSLYSFLRTPDDYFASILTAIQPGGDVDTTAAMTGAISGAHVGLEGLPLELAYKVNDQKTWDFDSLKALAWQAWAKKHA